MMHTLLHIGAKVCLLLCLAGTNRYGDGSCSSGLAVLSATVPRREAPDGPPRFADLAKPSDEILT
jgi:hypothetical protein